MPQTSARAGNYVNQPQGYSAFVPKPLPPDPPLAFDQEMLALLEGAARRLGQLGGVATVLPNPDLFVAMYVLKEAVVSSQVEGTQCSLVDVLEYQAQGARRGEARDAPQVVNYVKAMNYGLERVRELPLSKRLIREIHERLLEGVRGSERIPGEFRRDRVWIGAPGAGIQDAEFVPPPPHEIDHALDDLERFMHDQRMPPLIKAALVHAQFETIHPFTDGNGRVGRLLITFLLCLEGVLQQPLLYLSYHFKRNREEYYSRLQAVRDAGDWEAWVKFFLKAVAEVAEQAADSARRILQIREEHRNLIQAKIRVSHALPLHDMLLQTPTITVASVQERLGLKYVAANRLIKRFVEAGVLDQKPGHRRPLLFTYGRYVELLQEGTEPLTEAGVQLEVA